MEPVRSFTLSGLAARVEAARGLKFRALPRFVGCGPGEVARRHLEAVRRQLSPSAEEAKRRAWCAVGFRWEPDWPVAEALAGLAVEDWKCWYDAGNNLLFCDEQDLPVVRDASIPGLTMALAKVLLMQRYQGAVAAVAACDDATLAGAALLAADAARTAQLALLDVPLPSLTAVYDAFYATPRFVRELSRFPAGAGLVLADEWGSEGPGFSAFDRRWQDPPRSTADLWRRVDSVEVRCPAVPGRTPESSGTLGEFGIELLLKSQLTADEVRKAANGWRGDAWKCYQVGSGGDWGLTWKVVWQDAETALAFAEVLARTRLLARGLPESALSRDASAWIIHHPNFKFSVRPGGESGSVLVTASSAPEFVDQAAGPPAHSISGAGSAAVSRNP